eukprot:3702975-Prymnesium_polylepis.1
MSSSRSHLPRWSGEKPQTASAEAASKSYAQSRTASALAPTKAPPAAAAASFTPPFGTSRVPSITPSSIASTSL